MRKNRTRTNTFNSPLFCALFSLCATTAVCVLAVVCLRGALGNFWGNNGWWITACTSLVFATYYAISVFAVLRENQTLFRVLTSGYLLFLFAFIVWYILQKTGFFQVVGDEKKLESYLKQTGVWMPILYILLQLLQVILLPIPGFVSTAVGVTVFGPFVAMLCSFAGILLGSVIAFWIGRKLGYKAVSWIVGEDTLEKWLKKIKGKDNLVLSVMFFLPLFPDDVLCFVAGLSSMTWNYFLTVILFARAIGIAATCYSVNIIPFNTWWGILIWLSLIVAIVFIAVFLCKRLNDINAWIKEKRKKKNP